MDEEKALHDSLIIGVQSHECKKNEKLGITQEYNAKNRQQLWDSQKGKQAFKDETFGEGNSYYDPISGNVLHKTQKAAQSKYHMKNAQGENVSSAWANHASETDHIIPLKEIHRRTKGNVFLSDGDLKEIANQKENYRLLSKHLNASKGEQSDFKLALDPNSDMSIEARKTLLQERVKAEIFVDSRIAEKTLKNASGEFVKGASETLAASVIPLTSEAVRKLCNVASGKESLDEAVKDFGKTTLEVAVTGGGKQIVTDLLAGAMNNSKSVLLQRVASSNAVSQIITVGIIVKDSAVKYLNGEISGEEFVTEIGDKGVSMVASMIVGKVGAELASIVGGAVGTVILPVAGTAAGYAAGKIIGQLLGTIITTVACTAIFGVRDAWKHINDYKKKEHLIAKIEREALAEMKHQREILRELIEKEFHYWDEKIGEGFDLIFANACEEVYNAEGVAQGLDQILSVFGKSVKFSTMEEYENQIDAVLELSF